MKILATNKYAGMNYELFDKFEAGISLFGPEVKSIKEGSAILDNSFVIIKNNIPLLINFVVPRYKFDSLKEFDESRQRNLLLNKSEINKIFQAIKLKNLVVVPTRLYLNRIGLVKIEIATAKPLKKWDKRDKIRKEDQKNFSKSKIKF